MYEITVGGRIIIQTVSFDVAASVARALVAQRVGHTVRGSSNSNSTRLAMVR